MAVRPIDGNELYRIEKLLDTDIVRQDKVALNLLEKVLYDIQMCIRDRVYTLRAGEEKALRTAQREIGRAREDVEEEAAEMDARQNETER